MNNKCDSLNKKNIILFGVSVLFILGLFIIDKSNIANYIFALINLAIIYKFFNTSFRKVFYYITLLFAIMSMTLGIHLKDYIGIDEQINLYYIYLLGYMIIWFVNLIKSLKEHKKIKLDYINVLAIIFAIYTFISFIFAQDKKLAIVELLYYGVMFSLVIMIINENKSKLELKETLKFLGVVSIAILLMGTFKIVSGIQIEPNSVYLKPGMTMSSMYEPYNRIPTLFFYNPNNFSLVVVLILVGFSILLVSNTKYNKWIIGIVIYLAELNIVFSRSRTAWIASGVIFIFLAIVLLMKKQWKKTIIILIPLILFPITFKSAEVIENSKFLYEKLNELDNNISYEDGQIIEGTNISIGSNGSINVRATLYIDILQGVFKEKNYLGFGAGNINEYIRSRDNTHGRYDPHCWWLEILGDFGIIGFVSFALCYFIIAFRCFFRFLSNKSLQYISLLMLGLLAATFILVFSPSSVLRITPFWFIIGMAIAVSNLIREEKAN